MGDVADMMLDGTLCEGCGVYLEGEAPGYPRYCTSCKHDHWKEKHWAPPTKNHQCPHCKKKFHKKQGLNDHVRMVHPPTKMEGA
jgi:Zn finger protein HypA/HybF involved in hydrogenase expression